MIVTGLESFIVSVPFTDPRAGSGRGGTTQVIVKLTCDNGLVGWGESAGQLSNATAIEGMVRHAAPLVVGRDPWDKEAIAAGFFRRGTAHRWTQHANFAYIGIDHALWDLCGKDCGKPVYQLLGGALRDEVDHCYLLNPGTPESIESQAKEAVKRGYGVFYLPCGRDTNNERRMLEALRSTLGPEGRIRIDVNERWKTHQAIRLLVEWDREYTIEFCEAPVPHDRPQATKEVRERVPCAIGVNECLDSEAQVLELVRSRCADVYCFAPYWVGTMRRFVTLSHLIALEGMHVAKHTSGELGLSAAAGQHAALCAPGLIDGNQQQAVDLADDILTEPIPIASGPKWGLIEKPGLGVEVDEDKVARYHEAFLRDGQYLMPEFRGG